MTKPVTKPMTCDNSTPIIVGVGDVCETLTDELLNDLTQASSALDLAAQAAQLALDDAQINAAQIDTLAVVRSMPDSVPLLSPPFGNSNNPPASIATRIAAQPSEMLYSKSGGDVPQRMVNEYAELLNQGAAQLVLIAGGEANATSKAALRAQQQLDWAEQYLTGSNSTNSNFTNSNSTNLGADLEGMFGVEEFRHGLLQPVNQYAVIENARRSQLKHSPAQHAKAMAELFAPLSEVAKNHPTAMFPHAFSATEIATVSEHNPYIALPYTKRMVAKDGVNQGAAVLMTTVGKARELAIAEDKWVYLHAYAQASDIALIKRPQLGDSLALRQTLQCAMQWAGLTADDLSVIDLYSCFPIAVELAKEALGISATSSLALTQTGGLPYFGGPGNNYSLHAICAVIRELRKQPTAYGLVSANGGMLQKHAVGIYSCRAAWQHCDSSELQATIDNQPQVPVESYPSGRASIESYTVSFARGKPIHAIVVGRTAQNTRFLANPYLGDAATMQELLEQDCLGKTIYLRADGQANSFAFTQAQLPRQPKPRLKSSYKACTVAVQQQVLEITINRPESHNALDPLANEELASVFDAYLADADLRVAIITGAGDNAFCTGNDLKYSASGQPVWLPISGFAGLTARVGRNKPVIAAVNGFAMGGGFEIALASDIVLASTQAQFALPEVKHGLIAGAGGVVRLSRQIAHKQAMEMILTGRSMSAQEARDLGLVNQVLEPSELLPSARELAQQIAANSPTAIQLSMQLLHATANQGDANIAAGAGSRDVLDSLITSADFYEGPMAFAQKRPPKWTNR